jgi:hypothetical protein
MQDAIKEILREFAAESYSYGEDTGDYDMAHVDDEKFFREACRKLLAIKHIGTANDFGKKLKEYRVSRKASLSDVVRFIGESSIGIGYLADLEHGRKPPPDPSIIERIEIFLDIKDGALQAAAGSKDGNS